MFFLKLFSVARELLFKFVAPGLGCGHQPFVVVEMRNHRFGHVDVVAPEDVGHVAGAKTVEAQLTKLRGVTPVVPAVIQKK